MAAAIAGLMRCPAMQPHLPTEYTQQYTEEQQAAMLVGYNTRDSIQEVTAFGAKATATETQHKNSLYRGALTGEEAEHGQISQFSPGVAAVRAHRHFTAPLPSPPAQGVRRGPRRAARRAGPGNNRQ